MKRYKYGLNSQTLTSANFFELVTIGVIPVAPGETIGGKVTSQVLTESSTKVINNRTYNDEFAFYVPYRLVWDYWPEFIAGGTEQTIPELSSSEATWKQFMGRKYTGSSSGGLSQVNEFGRRAYNLIWNKFFRTPSVDEVSISQTTVLKTPLRSTTLNQRLKDSIDLADQTIDSSGTTITTGAIREAFAQDRFNKTRAYYGDKYTDYLAALGVEASWSILDEPELIGMSHNKLRFNMVDATAELDSVDPTPGNPDYVGSVGGRWQGTNIMSLKRTFAPEHGVIMFMSTTRMDIELENSKGYFEWLKKDRSRFYSPEFETERKDGWFPYLDTTAETELFLEKYDDYRTGQNLSDGTDNRNGTWISAPEVLNPTSEDILHPNPIAIQDYLNDQYEGTDINLSQMIRVAKVSPVRPSQSVHGVS